MKQLFVTDMDGTLLGSDSRVGPESAKIISELSRNGALITVATARTPATVDILLQDTFTLPPAIVMTGASLWDRKQRCYRSTHFIAEEDEAAILAQCAAHGLTPFIYTISPEGMIHTYYHGSPSRREQKFIDERAHLKLKRFHVMKSNGNRPSPVYPRVVLIFAIGDLDAVVRLASTLKSTCRCSVSAYPDIFNHSTGFVEIFAPGVDKASAVEALKRDLKADHLTVFGDNLNDLPMMAVADCAVAVENALPQVKEAADVVIGPNTADSVARYIESNILL